MGDKNLCIIQKPISFGTDGWRGILGMDFTLDNLLKVATASAQELLYRGKNRNKKIIIGYDRRMLAEEMAQVAASAVRGLAIEPILASCPLPTPACSWAVVKHHALGALVITASHNPPEWLGLKIKGPLGGSVDENFTRAVEKRILAGGISIPVEGETASCDFRAEHIESIQKMFDVSSIVEKIKKLHINIIVDPMHGSAAGCVSELLGQKGNTFIQEIRQNKDISFGGNPPEPMEKYLSSIMNKIKRKFHTGQRSLGLVFDGDGDRIAAIDEYGRYCNTQKLMPIFIDHLVRVRKLPGCVVKTVSGSDLMRLVGEGLGREVIEKPVGFKYIAQEMLEKKVVVGGEESGGVGFGSHIPERDALFAMMVLLESLTSSEESLAEKIESISKKYGNSYFERRDIYLNDMNIKNRIESFLSISPPENIEGNRVKEVVKLDGIKLIIDRFHWLMFRFSGTEPLLRIYCEAPTEKDLLSNLRFAKKFIEELL